MNLLATRLVILGGGGAVPVPVSVTSIGALFALLAMDRVPGLAPTSKGEKETLAVHVPPASRGEEATQLSVSEKSPFAATLSTVIGSVVAFVIVNC
jgi:hypothetical protein